MSDFDPEIQALRAIAEALESVEAEAHPRMLQWLVDRYLPPNVKAAAWDFFRAATKANAAATEEIICQHCGEVAR